MRNREIKIIILVSLAFIVVGLDIATSKKYSVENDTYRLESDFDAYTGETSKVAIVPSDYTELSNPVSRSTNPSYEQIEDMVRKAIELQGGFEWVIDPGDVVMLKVNLVGGNSPSGQGENTDVRVVKALIKVINDHTQGDVEIIVAEGTARSNDKVDEAGSVWDYSGYQDLVEDTYLDGINFRLFNLNQTYEQLIEMNLGNRGTAGPHGGLYHVHREELNADVYISVPVLKIHDTGLTNALKNQIGTAPGSYYGYNKTKGTSHYGGLVHDVDQRRWTTEEIVDLCAVADIDFVVVDAIMCLEKYKAYSGDNQVRFNTIVAGIDPVAVDHTCARLLCLNPDDIAHITLAEKIGLGTNNPADLEFVGSPIDDVKIKVEKNSSANGKFGQSNRSWLLSKSFSSTNIDEKLIPNEETVQAVGGVDGWSEAVYFFDDRIDLLSYYHGDEDIISYAFSYFSSPKTQEAELWLGTQEAIKVFINGEVVYKFTGTNVFNDEDLITDKVNVTLSEGINTLLVKSLNKFGDYSFCLNICEVESDSKWEGNRVEGLKFFTSDTSITDIKNIELKNAQFADINVWPNPASEKVNFSVDIESASAIEINITDVSGRRVALIASEDVSPGVHNYTWDLRDLSSKRASPGLYICTFRINKEYLQSKKLVVK